jgi:RNA polymerase sigma-70 factor (ECF subfamily)
MCNEGSSAGLEDATQIFLGVRNRLFGIAYRILNSRTDAEDIVQEAWLRWQMCDRNAVLDPPAFLSTTTARLCINVMQSARARHETHVRPWLPEPVDASADPQLGAERNEALAYAAITLIERLAPTERAAYVLREAFDYPYAKIAAIIGVTESNARQIVSRARKHLAIESERDEAASGAEHKRLVQAFVAAADGDLTLLEKVFAEDAVGGNGVRGAARVPMAA